MTARLPLVAAIAAGLLLYGPVLVAMGRQWVGDTTTSHGILLVAAAALVVYRRIPELRQQPVRPDAAGVALVFGGLVLYVLGSLGAEVFVLRFSAPIVALGGVAALMGRSQARLLLGAFGLCLLAIPLPGVIVTSLTMPMQLMASQMAEGMIAAGNIPVMRDGNLLRLDHVTLNVAEACSGLRSATSLISIAAVGTVLLGLSWQRGVLLMLIALPIAVVGNGARVAATGYLTQWFGERLAHGLPHELTGYAAFAVMCGLMVVVLRLTRPSPPKQPDPVLAQV